MSEGFFSRGFRGRRRQQAQDTHLPPGQYLVDGFPVLSAGPTPRTPLEEWDFSIVGEVDEPKRWPWEEFRELPSEEITTDIHCVTKWSKLGTRWEGVSVDTLLEEVEHGGPARLLVPHLYFWKSAKWVRGLRLVTEDEPGFWESLGYHNYGDPWREQRYWGD
jgi:DMSO/TMAO reductase YedYZ molybdopterin-dependent catalytic subunit